MVKREVRAAFSCGEARQDQHTLVIDPMFVDPQKADFTLKPGSPTVQVDFHAINLSEVGPRH